MLGSFFVAGLHVEERKVCVNELFLGLEFFSLVTMRDGGGEISFAIEGHAECELCVEVRRLNREDGVQSCDGVIEVAIAESKHCIVVLFLERFGHASR